MMMCSIKSKFTLGVTAWLVLYTGAPSATRMQKPQEVQPDVRQDTSVPPRHAPYSRMREKQRRLFVNNVRKIRLGETRQNVEALLGKPDADNLTGPKKTPKATKRLVWYYVTRYDKDLVNERFDERVFFTFDMTDRLKSINSNIPGIPNQP